MRFIYFSVWIASTLAVVPMTFANEKQAFLAVRQPAPNSAKQAQSAEGDASQAGAEAGAAAEQGVQTQTGQKVRGFMGGPGRRGQARAAIQACLQNKGVELPGVSADGEKPVLDDTQKEALRACVQDVRNAAAAARAAGPKPRGFGKRQAEAAGQRDTASAEAAPAESVPAEVAQ